MDVTRSLTTSSRASGKHTSSLTDNDKSVALKSTKTRQGKKTSYRHIPHSEKPAHLVAKRNERERRRVQAVNSAFLRLRKYVPHEPKNKRLSKFKTLKFAIQYIQLMQDMIQYNDWQKAYKEKDVGSLNSRDSISSDGHGHYSRAYNRRRTVKENALSGQHLSASNLISPGHRDENTFTCRNEYRNNETKNLIDFTNKLPIQGNYSSEMSPTYYHHNPRAIDFPAYTHFVPVESNNGYQRNDFEFYGPHRRESQLFHQEKAQSPNSLSQFGSSSSRSISPDLNLKSQEGECTRSRLCYFSDSSQRQTSSSTSSYAESWEDHGSDDVTSLTSHDVITPPMVSIPHFHQHISFIDADKYIGDHSNLTSDT